MDLRGHGESVTDEISVTKIRASVKSREEYFEKTKVFTEHWKKDVGLAYKTLLSKSGVKSISYIGASCGGAQVAHLASKIKPESIIFFSAYLRDDAIEAYKAAADVPTLILAAEEDEFTYNSSMKAYKLAKNINTKMVSYKGTGHGHPLFEHDPTLKSQMIKWFERFTN